MSNLGSGTTNSNSFFFDWSQLPESKYKVSFTFVSGVSPGYFSNAYPCNLFCDLGQGSNMTIASPQTSSVNYSSSFLGCLQIRECLASLAGNLPEYEPFLVAETNTNAPIYLDNRPRNNNVNIYMLGVVSSTGGTAYLPASGAYTLTLTFEMKE